MKLLILGGDGRAHTLVWKLFNSPQVTEILCTPGNAGTSQLASAVDLDSNNPAEITRWAFEQGVGIIVPASGEPLHHGLVDEAISFQVGVCGPSQRSTVLQRSRCSAKAFFLRHNLPTMPGRPFSDLATAEKFLATQPLPVIIKADHPSLGEGIYTDRYAAIAGLHELFNARPLQGSNDGVVIESYLEGPRVVMSAFTDGRTAVPLLPTRLYDRASEETRASSAVGIGAHTSNSRYGKMLGDYLHQKIIQPIVAKLSEEGLPYWGILSIDCIITPNGPRLTALRCSFHEGEAQVVLPRLEDDLLPWVQAMIAQRLHELPAPNFAPVVSVGLGLFARGYPNYFATGGTVQGLEDLDNGVLVFHNTTENIARPLPGGSMFGFGTTPSMATGMLINGGQPLTLVTTAATLAGARGQALVNAERVRFDGRMYNEHVGANEFA